jgi:hypothetical protein
MTSVSVGGDTRALERVMIDAADGVGLFGVDGPGQIGAFTFTIAADGTPTLADQADAPSLYAAVALDPPNAAYVAGMADVYGYALGSDFALPATPSSTAGCTTPADLIVASTGIFELCSDSAAVTRFAHDPTFASGSASVGSPGAVGQALALPNDRAVATLLSPPELVVLELGINPITWVDGPMLPATATALAVSADGTFVVTTEDVGSAAEIDAWAMVGDQLVSLASVTVAGTTIDAVAITPPGP